MATFRYYRLQTTKVRSTQYSNSLSVGEFELRNAGVRLTGMTVTAPGADSPGWNTTGLPPKAADNDPLTAWDNFTPTVGYLLFDFGTPKDADSYRIATGPDQYGVADRDPVSWVVSGSNDGTAWTVLDTQTDYPVPVARSSWTPTITLGGGSTAPSFTGTAALTGSGSLTASGTASIPTSAAGEAALTGSGALSAAAALTTSGTAALTGSGALSAVSTVSVTGSATLTGSGALDAVYTVSFPGTSDLSGSGSLTATGSSLAYGEGAAAFTGSGTLEAVGTATMAGGSTISLAGSGTLEAIGSALTTSGAASLSGGGTLSAAATSTTASGEADLTGSGSLSALAAVDFARSASLTGSGTLTGSGSKGVGAPRLTGTADLTGSGHLWAYGLSSVSPLRWVATDSIFLGKGAAFVRVFQVHEIVPDSVVEAHPSEVYDRVTRRRIPL